GLALYEMGRLDEAIGHFREAIRLDPKASARAHNNLGLALYEMGRLDEAIGHFREAIRLDPKASAKAHNNLAPALRAKGRLDEAIAEFEQAQRLEPGWADPYNNLAWLLATCQDVKVRDPQRAVALAKKAVERAPKNGEDWNTLGVAHYRAGDMKAAIDALEKS